MILYVNVRWIASIACMPSDFHGFQSWQQYSSRWMTRDFKCVSQSAEYVKYAKIFGDYFWLIFIPTEDLGDHFLKILCLLKILVTHSCRFYAYWRSCRVNGDPFLLYSFLFHFNFQKIFFLLHSKKDHTRVCQFGDLRNGVDMKWYDYMKCSKEINCIFLKEKENCRLKYE